MILTQAIGVESIKEYTKSVFLSKVRHVLTFEVYTAKAGEKDLNTNIVNNQDWGTGTMFLSTNNRTWTEYVDEDLKFTIKAARFQTKSADVTLENEDLEFLQSNTSNINGKFTPGEEVFVNAANACLLYTSPSPRDRG